VSRLLDFPAVNDPGQSVATAPSVLTPSGDPDRLRMLAARRLRSRGLASPRLDHHSSRVLDPMPRLVDAGSWATLEAGIAQRLRALAALADDLYGARRTVSAGVVPADVVYANPAFALAADGWAPPGGRRLALAAFDVRHDPGRGWVVVADRLSAPAQLGRALENREVMTQLAPLDLQQHRVRRLGHFQARLRRALGALAPAGTAAPRVLLLSPGRAHPEHPELAELARVLGYTLAEADDLTVRHGELFLSSVSGLEPVHVLARFGGDRALDPLELPGPGTSSIAGLLGAVRRGRLAVANAIGTELLETVALHRSWPDVTRLLLGEEPLLAGETAWWCGDAADRATVSAQLGALVLHPLDPAREPLDARLLDGDGLEVLRRAVDADPVAWSARVPTPGGTELIRVFAVSDGAEVTVMPGGFATEAGRSGTSADVWVPHPPDRSVVDLPVRVAGLAQVDFAGSLPSRAGEAMFVLGGRLERAEVIVRLARSLLDRAEQESLSDLPSWLGDLGMALDHIAGGSGLADAGLAASAFDVVEGALCDQHRWDGLPGTVSQVLTAAGSARELLAMEIWDGLGRLRETVQYLAEHGVRTDLGRLRDQLDQLLGDLASVSGVVHESMVRGPGWHLLDAGRRLERAHRQVELLARMIGDQAVPVPEEVLETLLTTAVSLVAYRRRHRSDLELDAVLAILLLDPSNPRSVRAALAGLVDDLDQLPRPQRPDGRDATLGQARALHDLVAGLQPDDLAARSPLDERAARLQHVLGTLAAALPALADSLTDVYLRHVFMARLPVDARERLP
jgi:uncharacterized circularly permuted ATP-grasp superfamily protein/uncharacterized alpha-E superfamily protein